MSDNPSKTIDGSGTSPLTIDSGDRDNTNAAPIVPEVRLDGDGAELQTALDIKYFGLGRAKLGQLDIPSVKDQNALQLEGDAGDALRGNSQHDSEISRLSARLEVLTAESAKMSARGMPLPANVSQEMAAIRSSISLQMNRQRAAAPDLQAEEFERDQQTLLKAYETDLELAVMQMMRDKKVDKRTAIELVTSKSTVMGQASVLPQFDRIERRMKAKWGK